MIDEYECAYDAMSRRAKTILAGALVELVQSRQGRFLKQDGSGWVEIPDAMARSKVANCFRTNRHRNKKKGNGAAF